jgi:hypothetical protein
MLHRGLEPARADRVKWSEAERQKIVSAAADLLDAGSCLSVVKLLTEAQQVLPRSRRRHSFSLKRIAWFMPAVESERLRRGQGLGQNQVVITGYDLDRRGRDNDPYIPLMTGSRDEARATREAVREEHGKTRDVLSLQAEALAEIRQNHRAIREAIERQTETLIHHDGSVRRHLAAVSETLALLKEERAVYLEQARAMLAAIRGLVAAINNTGGPLPCGRDGSDRGNGAPEGVQAASA